MAFNGSGTFNLASGNPVVSGATISSTWANNTLADIASGLTNTITRDGQSPATANLPMGNYKITGLAAPTATGDAVVFGENATLVDATVDLLKLKGSSSGYVGIKGAAAAGSTTYTMPSSDGAASQFLGTDGAGNLSWGNVSPFVSGTALLFAQTAAPTGWTKLTTHNDKALRVVSGTASSGGSVAFTTAFASQTPAGTIGSYTLATADIPSHTHNVGSSNGVATTGSSGTLAGGLGSATSSSTGGGGSHSHSFTGTAINLAVQYVDVIIATKD